MTKMAALVEEMTQAGVLEATGALASTKKGARLRFQGGKHTVLDGPFTESKELIAGYSMLELLLEGGRRSSGRFASSRSSPYPRSTCGRCSERGTL